MYPANVVVGAVVPGGGGVEDCGTCVSGVSFWGGSTMGTPVSECRRGGIVVRDWDVGARMRRRRGLAMFLTFGFETSGAEVEVMMDLCLIVMVLNVSLCGFERIVLVRLRNGQGMVVGGVGEEACPRMSKKCCGDATSPIGYQH